MTITLAWAYSSDNGVTWTKAGAYIMTSSSLLFPAATRVGNDVAASGRAGFLSWCRIGGVVVVGGSPDMKVVVAGLELSQKALAADAVERENKKAAEEKAAEGK